MNRMRVSLLSAVWSQSNIPILLINPLFCSSRTAESSDDEEDSFINDMLRIDERYSKGYGTDVYRLSSSMINSLD